MEEIKLSGNNRLPKYWIVEAPADQDSTEFELFSVVATDVFSQPFDSPNYRSLYQVSIPRMVGKDNYFDVPNAAGSGGYNYKPRLLKCIKAMIFDDMPITQRDTYNNLRSFASLAAIIQLDFADTLSWKTLYPLYYRDFYDGISKGFEVSCLVNLNAYDYTQMRINRPINYNGVIFYLKTINGFNPVNNSLTITAQWITSNVANTIRSQNFTLTKVY